MLSVCGCCAGLCLRDGLRCALISVIVVLKHVPGACVIKLLLEWYVFMLWSLFVVVQLQQYPAESQVTSALSLSLDRCTVTMQCRAGFVSSEPNSTPNIPAEGYVESSSLSLAHSNQEVIRRAEACQCLSGCVGLGNGKSCPAGRQALASQAMPA